MDILEKMRTEWQGEYYIPRTKVTQFSQGLLHPRTLANADSLGCGPKEKIRCGKKVYYSMDSLLAYISDRLIDSR